MLVDLGEGTGKEQERKRGDRAAVGGEGRGGERRRRERGKEKRVKKRGGERRGELCPALKHE